MLVRRIRGLPTRFRRRTKRALDFSRRIVRAALHNQELLKVIRRVPGARVDPYYDPAVVKQYRPVGRCIYCPRTDNLSDEHILAYSLGGDAVLPKASCPTCANVTKKIEEYCANQIFLDIRVHHHIHSRSPSRTHLTVHELADPTTGKLDRHLIPVTNHPGWLVLPSFDPPGIVMGKKPSNDFGTVILHGYSINEDHDERVAKLGRESGSNMDYARY